MISLADLDHLPRPGSGVPIERCRDLFWGSAIVAALNWPKEVVDQFLFDHGTNEGFRRQYGDLDLSALRWKLEMLSASELASAGVYFGFADWLHNVEADPHEHIGRRPERRAAWAESGSWRVPPILLDRSLLERGGHGFHLVEGHTRVGTLRGLLALGDLEPGSVHRAWVGTAAGATDNPAPTVVP
jgi:hypothetical protein